MRDTTNLFLINGKPMLLPDEQVLVSYEDIDSADAGRDESGVMHRIMLRCKLGSWSFSYGHLKEEEKQYMESLFANDATFSFTHPDRLDASKSVTDKCYRSKYSISWRNARTGIWNGYGFSIIQC